MLPASAFSLPYRSFGGGGPPREKKRVPVTCEVGTACGSGRAEALRMNQQIGPSATAGGSDSIPMKQKITGFDKADEDHVDGPGDGDVEASDDEGAYENGKHAAIRLPKINIGLCGTRSI